MTSCRGRKDAAQLFALKNNAWQHLHHYALKQTLFVDYETRTSYGRGKAQRGQAAPGGAKRGGARRAGRGGSGARRRGAVRPGDDLSFRIPEQRRQPSCVTLQKREQNNIHVNLIDKHDSRLIIGLLAGPRALFVPGCWLMDRRLLVSVSSCEASPGTTTLRAVCTSFKF